MSSQTITPQYREKPSVTHHPMNCMNMSNQRHAEDISKRRLCYRCLSLHASHTHSAVNHCRMINVYRRCIKYKEGMKIISESCLNEHACIVTSQYAAGKNEVSLICCARVTCGVKYGSEFFRIILWRRKNCVSLVESRASVKCSFVIGTALCRCGTERVCNFLTNSKPVFNDGNHLYHFSSKSSATESEDETLSLDLNCLTDRALDTDLDGLTDGEIECEAAELSDDEDDGINVTIREITKPEMVSPVATKNDSAPSSSVYVVPHSAKQSAKSAVVIPEKPIVRQQVKATKHSGNRNSDQGDQRTKPKGKRASKDSVSGNSTANTLTAMMSNISVSLRKDGTPGKTNEIKKRIRSPSVTNTRHSSLSDKTGETNE